MSHLLRISLGMLGWCLTGLLIGMNEDNPVTAAEWSMAPSMSTKAYYNDNLLLTPLPHSATYGYWLSPGVQFAGKTERLEVNGRAALDFVDYYGGRPSRFTNVLLPLTVRYRTETDEWGFTGGYTRDNTLMSELLTTGVVLNFTQRNAWTANPTWTHNLTEKWAVQSSAQFAHTSYENKPGLNLVDYQVYGASTGVMYHADERSDIQLSGTYTNFHTLSGAFGMRSSIPGIMLSLSHAFHETIKGTIYGGPRFLSSTTQSQGVPSSSFDIIWVYGANLSKQFEQAALQLSFTRDIFPSGFGLLITTDRLSLSGSYNISNALMASLDVSTYAISAAGSLPSGRGFSDQQLLYVTPKITWQFSEWWRVEASYSHRSRDTDALADPALSNMVTVMGTYFPPQFSWSK